MIPPVSMSLSIIKVVTPVCRSPLMTAQLIGAAPRYCGRRAACRLKVPRRGMDHTSCGSILKATTTKRSAFHAASAERNSGSLSFSGCRTGIPCSTAYFLTALSCISCPRPLGLSATVTTPTTLYPACTRASREATANSGVPMNTILVGWNHLATLLLAFLHQLARASLPSSSVESCTAFHERKAPIGPSTRAEMNAPMGAATAPSLASFVPEISTTQ